MATDPKPGKEHTFQMRVSLEFMERIDEWRRGQRDIPSRAEAIRRIVTAALDAQESESAGVPHAPPRKKRLKVSI